MMYGPQLITLMGDDRAPEPFGFWATAAAAAAKIGVKVGKGIAKKVKSKRKKKKQAAVLRRASVAENAGAVGVRRPGVVPVTENELRAASSMSSARVPVVFIGVAAIGLLLLLRGGSK